MKSQIFVFTTQDGRLTGGGATLSPELASQHPYSVSVECLVQLWETLLTDQLPSVDLFRFFPVLWEEASSDGHRSAIDYQIEGFQLKMLVLDFIQCC